MVSPGFVVQGILDELKAGDTHGIKRLVVCPAGVSVGYGGHPEVLQRGDPLLEDAIHRRIALGVDAPNLARSVVDVEIR